MRLIDADVADKWMQQNNAFIDSAILKAIPTIDAVPVVRCRECIHRAGTPGQPNILCGQMHDDDFCFYGQRKIETVLLNNDKKDKRGEKK